MYTYETLGHVMDNITENKLNKSLAERNNKNSSAHTDQNLMNSMPFVDLISGKQLTFGG